MSMHLEYRKLASGDVEITLDCEDRLPGTDTEPWLDQWSKLAYMVHDHELTATEFVELRSMESDEPIAIIPNHKHPMAPMASEAPSEEASEG